MDIKKQLILHEGKKLRLYKCSADKWTIGVGRNIEDRGISESEALFMLDNDINRVVDECNQFLWFHHLSDIRKRIIIDMVFNLGLSRFRGFKKMIACLEYANYIGAANEMLDSKWAREDVGVRAVRLAAWMKFNKEVIV